MKKMMVRIWILALATAAGTAAYRAAAGFSDAAAAPTVVLGAPTDASIAASVLADRDLSGYLEYGTSSGSYPLSTPAAALPASEPVEMAMGGLRADGLYYYRLRYKAAGEASYAAGAEGTFRTQRSPGQPFVFAVQADSHPERGKSMFNAELYARTLGLAAADRPDFFITLGDDFSIDTLKSVTAAAVGQVYLTQRAYLAPLLQSCPAFLVNGNHEQAAAYLLDGTPDNAAVWAQNARNRNFPQPAPDGFYTGDEAPVPYIGLLRDYYAWTWGDALFAVIDPYWHSPIAVDTTLGAEDDADKRKDKWAITLGEEQYRWLKRTLLESRARYKFVFAHHVQGGGRGGVEIAGEYEWGGRNDKGAWEFDAKRPGWGLPIHQLMAQAGVTIFFQGHDHLFAKQDLDGVIYQECPIPADYTYTAFNEDAYLTGIKAPNAGYLRVSVSEGDVRVEYVRSYLAADVPAGHKQGEVAVSYSVNQRGKKGGIRRAP